MSALTAEVLYRTCPKCEMDRPLGHFNKHKRQCKECRAANQRRYYSNNRDRVNESNKARGRALGIHRRRHLAEIYGEFMTPEVYDQILADQGGVCAICRQDVTRVDGASGAIDHDHVTGEIRGILCNRCNPMLGYAQDDPDRLMAAIAYLARFQQH